MMAKEATTTAVAQTAAAMEGPEALIARAIDKGVPIDVMERLLAMRRELKAEAAREAYFTSLAAFQAQCPEIPKGKQVVDKNGNPRYRYAPIEQIVAVVKEPLSANGFSYVLDSEQDDSSVTGVCASHHIQGHSETTRFKVPIDKDAYMNEPQKFASARTFAQRYAFKGAYGIQTGDEDEDATSVDPEHSAAETEEVPAMLKCPACGAQAVIKGKAEYGGGWLCWKKRGGCGEKFADTDPRFPQPEGAKSSPIPAMTSAKTGAMRVDPAVEPVRKDLVKRLHELVDSSSISQDAAKAWNAEINKAALSPTPAEALALLAGIKQRIERTVRDTAELDEAAERGFQRDVTPGNELF